MSIQERVEIYNQIETHRGRPLLVYVTSKRYGVRAKMASDVLPYMIDQLDTLPPETEKLDFLIVSFGGDPMVAWRIISLMRERVKNVSVLLPHSAYSAATLVALGANEIIMHPNSHLGPVDMQINIAGEDGERNFSTEDISEFLSFVRETLGITDQEHLRVLFELTCKEVGSLGVGFTSRSQKLAIDLGEKLLGMHMKDDPDGSKRRALIDSLSRKFQHHSYPVSRKEAIDMDLPVNKERDETLESLMWKLWLNIEEELKERTPFFPVVELANSSEASKLLSPVPQLGLPVNAPSPTYFSANISDITKAKIDIDPVEYELNSAIIESSRKAYRHMIRGVILGARLPDLSIQFNPVNTFNSWEETPVNEEDGDES